MLLTVIPGKVCLFTRNNGHFFDISINFFARLLVNFTPYALVYLHLTILLCKGVLIGRSIISCQAEGDLKSINTTKHILIGEVLVERGLQDWNVRVVE